MGMIIFGIVGGCWRTEFYLRIARALPDRFGICGVVVRDEDKGIALERNWGIKTFRTVDQLLESTSPAFVVVSVSWQAAPEVSKLLAAKGMPVLTETPPAPDLESLLALNQQLGKNARIQVAEQYHLQPLHAARQKVADSARLGDISQVQISVCHGYHAMSLLRKFLGLKYENATIQADRFISPLVGGPNRLGILDEEKVVDAEQIIARLDFGGKLAIYDFTGEQYFSWIRALRLVVRGSRGEIVDDKVRYLQDFRTPVELSLRRLNAGEDGNLEGLYLKGILAGDEWLYKNPFIGGRLTDDEIAIATCLEKMDVYVHGGPGFYSLAEASQDHYLAMMVERAAKNKETIQTRTQPWAMG